MATNKYITGTEIILGAVQSIINDGAQKDAEAFWSTQKQILATMATLYVKRGRTRAKEISGLNDEIARVIEEESSETVDFILQKVDQSKNALDSLENTASGLWKERPEEREAVYKLKRDFERTKELIKRRSQQVQAFQDLLAVEAELLNVDPPDEIRKLQQELKTELDPENQAEIQSAIASLEKGHEEWVSELLVRYQEVQKVHRQLSDNFSRGLVTDTEVVKGKLYPLEERAANIFAKNESMKIAIEEASTPGGSAGPSRRNSGEVKPRLNLVPPRMDLGMAGYQGPTNIVPIQITLGRARQALADAQTSMKTLQNLELSIQSQTQQLLCGAEDSTIQEALNEAFDIQETMNREIERRAKEQDAEKALERSMAKLDLPPWGGGQEDYMVWRRTQVQLNVGASEISRVRRLQRTIKNKEVSTMVQHSSTFDQALQILDQRFGDKRIYIPKVLQRLERLKAAPSTASEEAKTCQEIKNGFEELRLYDELHQVNEHLIGVLAGKLRPANRDAWFRLVTTSPDVVDDQRRQEMFEHFINQELAVNYQTLMREPAQSRPPKEEFKRKTANVKRVATQPRATDRRGARQISCWICEEGHLMYRCPMLGDAGILTVLDEKGICERCLRRPCQGGSQCGRFVDKEGKIKTSDCKHGCKNPRNGKPLNFKLCSHDKEENKVKSNRISSKTGGGICLTETVQLSTGRLATVLYDGGSDTSLCTKEIEREGQRVETQPMIMELADGSMSKLNKVPVIGLKIGKHKIEALGVNTLTRTKPYDLKVPERWQRRYNLARNIVGDDVKIDILIGADCMNLMPKEVAREGSLTLFESIVTGKHLIGGKPMEENHAIRKCAVRRVCVQMEKIADNFQKATTIEGMDMNKAHMENFKDKQKREEDKWMKENLTYDPAHAAYTINLIHNDKLPSLEENKERVKKIQEKLGKRLQRDEDLREKVNQQIMENVKKGFWIPADAERMEDQKLKRSYLPFQAELNPNSTSTPVRLVLNSSLKGKNGISLNTTYQTGSNEIGCLKTIIANTRLRPKLIAADIKKFYYNFFLTEEESYLHLLMVPVKPDQTVGYGETYELKPYRQTRLTFGDSPSPTAATLARKRIAEEATEDEKIKDIFLRCSYIDDVFAWAGYDEPVEPVIEKLENVVQPAGMEFKKIYYSGMTTDDDEKDVNLFQNSQTKALGYIWNVVEEEYKLKINFALRGQEITQKNVDTTLENLTKREALALTMSLYDPLGLFCPISLKMKFVMADVFDSKLEWDMKVGTRENDLMKEAVKEVLKMEDVGLDRCVIPPTSWDNEREVIGFADASEKAVGYVIYVRSRVGQEKWEARLLMAKTRTGGVRKLSVPRGELLAYQMLALGLRFVMLNLDVAPVSRILAFTDSQIVAQQLKKNASSMDVYTGSRVDLIKTIFEEHGVQAVHMRGVENPADMCTKICTAEQMKSEFWQKTSFLHKPENEWPVYKAKVNLVRSQSESKCVLNLNKILNPEKYRSLGFVKRVLSWILKLKYKNATEEERLKLAQEKLELDAIRATEKHRNKAFCDYRTYQDKFGRIFLLGRQVETEQKRMLLVDKESLLGKLVILSAHDQHHGYGSRFIAAKIRESFYIPRLTNKLMEVSRNCYRCKILQQQEMEQLMAPQKGFRLETTPPFTHIMVDLAGPVKATDEVKRRTTRKIYFLVISCLNTRALNVVVTRDLTTDAFILALRCHIAVRGEPKVCYSDLGTNFTGGKRVLIEGEEGELDPRALENIARQGNFVMKFGTPEHHAGQGAVEKMVHLFKTALRRTNGGQIPLLSFAEWVTTTAEMVSLVNSRPLALEPGCGEAVTAGEILTFRPVSSPLMSTEVKDAPLTRRSAMQREFLKQWYERFFLAYREKIQSYQRKWRKEQPNLAPKDVVLILDKPSVHQPFTLGLCGEVVRDSDGKVRKAWIEFSTHGQRKRVKRHVTSLCLLLKAKDPGREIIIPGIDGRGNQDGAQDDKEEQDGAQEDEEEENQDGAQDDEEEQDGAQGDEEQQDGNKDDVQDDEEEQAGTRPLGNIPGPGITKKIPVRIAMEPTLMKDVPRRRRKKPG